MLQQFFNGQLLTPTLFAEKPDRQASCDTRWILYTVDQNPETLVLQGICYTITFKTPPTTPVCGVPHEIEIRRKVFT